MTIDERIEFYEREERRARRDARRRGVVQPSLAPEVRKARAHLRFWRGHRDRRAPTCEQRGAPQC